MYNQRQRILKKIKVSLLIKKPKHILKNRKKRMKNKKKSRKADLNCLLGPLQYLVNHQLAQQKLVVYLDKILYYLTVLYKDNHHFLVMQINLLITKIKIQRFQNSVFHLGKMDKKKVKKQINFLCFLIV